MPDKTAPPGGNQTRTQRRRMKDLAGVQVLGFAPIASPRVLGEWLGVGPEAILAAFEAGRFDKAALIRSSPRCFVIDLQALIASLKAKQAGTNS